MNNNAIFSYFIHKDDQKVSETEQKKLYIKSREHTRKKPKLSALTQTVPSTIYTLKP